MSVSASIPTTVQIRRTHLLGLVVGVAALAATVTGVVLALAFDTGGASEAASRAQATPAATKATPSASVAIAAQYARGFGSSMTPAQLASGSTPTGSVAAAAQYARGFGSSMSIMSLTPAQLAARALGTGYALPTSQSGPTVESVLASMSPETRRYTEAVMGLTFEQLAAGAAGHP